MISRFDTAQLRMQGRPDAVVHDDRVRGFSVSILRQYASDIYPHIRREFIDKGLIRRPASSRVQRRPQAGTRTSRRSPNERCQRRALVIC
jgi:hypothetical protein